MHRRLNPIVAAPLITVISLCWKHIFVKQRMELMLQAIPKTCPAGLRLFVTTQPFVPIPAVQKQAEQEAVARLGATVRSSLPMIVS